MTIYHRDGKGLQDAVNRVLQAYEISDVAPEFAPLIIDKVF